MKSNISEQISLKVTLVWKCLASDFHFFFPIVLLEQYSNPQL